ncbi:hypothetical protein D8M04_06470 [Oceanobacillus piezotolerans]|uniref:Uncharacterized protein n=1 Tax=Oceanobacillus piezotolerans TaxID=2448030 RepID=A0A498DQT7_9BACI|nr:hypothetical protein [Oceanobacillus piezotolerans]RLL46839.1 hypothetical protein D8M04_06470 [Oceanobacillus piezotolerans]
MFDKSYTLQLVNKVIKEEIIPSLNSSVAKEQAIAMISVLKSVDVNSEQNLKPYIEVNELLQTELTRILDSIEKSINGISGNIQRYQIQLEQVKTIKNVKKKWEKLNNLLSEFITELYQMPENTQTFIDECRTLLRKQLDIEMSLVG